MKSAKTVRLGDVCEVINGLWKGVKPPFKRVGIIRSTNFTKWCELTLDNTAYIDVEEKKYQSRKLQAGDLIVERSGGTTDSPVGRIVLFNVSKGDYSISNFTSILRVKDTEALDPLYLHRYLKSLYFQGKTKDIQSNTTNIHNLDFNAYLDFEIPLPPLSEQKAIVARLDEALARATRLAEHFTTIAKNADLSFKATLAEIFENVSGKEVRLGDVCEVLDTIRRTITQRDSKAGPIPYYGATGIVDHVEGYIFDEPLLLLGEDGAKWGACDNSAFLIDGKAWVNNHAHVLRVKSQLDRKFAMYYLNLADLSEYITGVTVPKLNQARMCAISLPLPPLYEQEAIVARLDAARARSEGIAEQARRGAAAAENLKKALLKEAFE